jgi:hypothetical protein
MVGDEIGARNHSSDGLRTTVNRTQADQEAFLLMNEEREFTGVILIFIVKFIFVSWPAVAGSSGGQLKRFFSGQ